MARIVRFEEIDGQLILRVPAGVAARLRFSAGDEVVLTVEATCLIIERREARDQSVMGSEIAADHRGALSSSDE